MKLLKLFDEVLQQNNSERLAQLEIENDALRSELKSMKSKNNNNKSSAFNAINNASDS